MPDTHREVLDAPVGRLAVVPQFDHGHLSGLVKDDVDLVEDAGQHGSQPHVLAVLGGVQPVDEFVRGTHVPVHPLQHVDTVRVRRDI